MYEEDRLAGYVGQGRVSQQVLSELKGATELACRSAVHLGLQPCVVWAIHFPPEFSNNDPRLELLAGHDLVLGAEDCNVAMILAGHTHEARAYQVSGNKKSVPVFCSGSATGLSREKKFSYFILEIDVAQSGVGANVVNYEWSDELHELDFMPQPIFP
jgi:hypothetical protein